jgi:hypothetical protein
MSNVQGGNRSEKSKFIGDLVGVGKQIEVTRAIVPQNYGHVDEILHRKGKEGKFNHRTSNVFKHRKGCL